MTWNLWWCKGIENNVEVSIYARGAIFPVNPSDGDQYYRSDLNELFHYSQTLSGWLGEAQFEGYGDSGNLNNNQYFRRFNGMGLGTDRGVGLPYDVIVLEHSVNWESPNNSTGSIEIETGGAVLSTLPTVGDGPSHNYPNVVIPADSIIAFRRDGNNISNTQGRIKFKRFIS